MSKDKPKKPRKPRKTVNKVILASPYLQKWARECNDIGSKPKDTVAEEKTKTQILKDFAKKIFESQRPMDREAAKILEDNFWDCVGEDKGKSDE